MSMSESASAPLPSLQDIASCVSGYDPKALPVDKAQDFIALSDEIAKEMQQLSSTSDDAAQRMTEVGDAFAARARQINLAVETAATQTDNAGAALAQRVEKWVGQQRDTLASVARWYIGPLVPGMALFVMASTLTRAQTTSLAPALISNGLVAALAGFGFWGVIALNRHAARALDAQIAALDAERDPTDD